jgi:hypothetical protein
VVVGVVVVRLRLRCGEVEVCGKSKEIRGKSCVVVVVVVVAVDVDGSDTIVRWNVLQCLCNSSYHPGSQSYILQPTKQGHVKLLCKRRKKSHSKTLHNAQGPGQSFPHAPRKRTRLQQRACDA